MKKNFFEQPQLESDSIEILSARLLETTAELLKANNELKRIQTERNEMLANISHDLRAPITAIRSAVDYLVSGRNVSEEDFQSTLALIDRRTKTLEDLIQDMYYLFCVEDRSRDFSLETVDAIPFLEEYFFDLSVDTRYDNHNLLLDIPDGMACTINIDIPKLIRVLDNLFTNAAKYTPHGSNITLGASFGDDKKVLKISVTDNGPGIPEESVKQIFNRTYTVSSARTPNTKTGSGLGLSIVSAIIERHGGTVTCKSNEGSGTTFTFTLPCIL